MEKIVAGWQLIIRIDGITVKRDTCEKTSHGNPIKMTKMKLRDCSAVREGSHGGEAKTQNNSSSMG